MIINADDFGLSEGVTRGIVEAHQAGAVTSASIFANAPGFEGAVTAARSVPALDLGLHFNVTVGLPLSPPQSVRSLCDAEGRFLTLGALVRRSFRGGIRPEHVALECRAQLERVRAAGITVTHIDGHRHAHVLPGIWSGVVAVAREAGISMVRVPVEPLAGGRPAAKLAVRLTWWLGAGNAREPRPAPHFRGIGLLGASRLTERLLRLLDRLPLGDTEVMVHPGYVDDDLMRWDRYGAERECELLALRSPEVLSRLTQGGLRLARFADL